MDETKKLRQIQEQTAFCDQLMKRIARQVTNAKITSGSYSCIKYGGFGEHISGYTVVSNDIIRLRCELLNLEKMVVNIYG